MTQVVIVKMSSIGDILQTIAPLAALISSRPDIQLTWVIEKRYAHLVSELKFIDKVIPIDTYALRKKIDLKLLKSSIKSLKNSTYDLALDLQGNLKSALILSQIKAFKKVGFDFKSAPEKIASLFVSQKIKLNLKEPILDQTLSFLNQAFTAELKRTDLKRVLLGSAKSPYPETQNCYFVTIGTRWENKKLGLETWVNLLTHLNLQFKLCFWLPFASHEEEAAVDLIALKCPGFALKFPKCDLITLQQAIATSKGLIGVDSALTHLAGLTHVPIFTFFGPSSLKVYNPLNASGLQGSCPVGQSFEKRCAYLRTCSHGNCLKGLQLPQIEDHIKQFIQYFN